MSWIRACWIPRRALDKDSAGLEGLVDHRPRNIAPFLSLLTADDDYVEGNFEISKLAAEAC